MVPWAVMISTGSRGWRVCTDSISVMPSVGSMRRSNKATSKRPPSTAAVATWGSLVAVTSKPSVTRRISSTSTMAMSSSTTSTLRFIVAGALRPAWTEGGLFEARRGCVGLFEARRGCVGLFEVRRGCVGLFEARRGCVRGWRSLASFQLEVDLLEALEVGLQTIGLLADTDEIAVAPGQILAQPRQLFPQARQLRARAEQRPQRLPARRRPRRRLRFGILRQVLAVGGHRVLQRALASQPIGPIEHAGAAGLRQPGAAA